MQGQDYIGAVSVGVQGKKLRVSGWVWTADVKACSVQVFLRAKLSSSVDILTHLPLNFATTNANHFLTRA